MVIASVSIDAFESRSLGDVSNDSSGCFFLSKHRRSAEITQSPMLDQVFLVFFILID
ncbi:hypothetical protein D3C76_475080 [compost metagenome]